MRKYFILRKFSIIYGCDEVFMCANIIETLVSAFHVGYGKSLLLFCDKWFFFKYLIFFSHNLKDEIYPFLV